MEREKKALMILNLALLLVIFQVARVASVEVKGLKQYVYIIKKSKGDGEVM